MIWFKVTFRGRIYIFNIHFYVYECFIFMCTGIPCLCLVPAEARRVHQTLGVTSSCELTCGCWKLNPDLLERQVSDLLS